MIQKIWNTLSGKTVTIGGNTSPAGSAFTRLLSAETGKNQLELRKPDELQNADYVIIFAENDTEEKNEKLLADLLKASEMKPKSAVLVTDQSVYGKCFGQAHGLKENEMGYACHTRTEDRMAYGMRLAEHMASRLMREENMPVKIIRMDQKQEASAEMMQAILAVLLYGDNGEAYNYAPASIASESGQEQTETRQSWLSPLVLKLNTEKISRLIS